MKKVNPFPIFPVPFPLTFLSNLFIVFETNFLTNPGKLFLAKGIAIFFIAFFLKLPKTLQGIHLIESFWTIVLYYV